MESIGNTRFPKEIGRQKIGPLFADCVRRLLLKSTRKSTRQNIDLEPALVSPFHLPMPNAWISAISSTPAAIPCMTRTAPPERTGGWLPRRAARLPAPAGAGAGAQRGSCARQKTYFSTRKVNAYFTADDPALSDADLRRIFMDRTSGFVTRDLIPADAIVHRVYVAQAMKRFVANCSRLIRARIRPGCWTDPRTRRVMNIDNAGSPSGALSASRSRIGLAARNNPHILMTSITVFFLSLN
ncbi:hypothetical protein [Caballeronia sp. dw_19]|uniref:hypothetical protein n=1 Tax=Caballeronia sp. dw_19 TaxID=2719791 RepID=UPI001BD20191|nr:hypothetical protein [Caballeronia sp. dw_19]